MEPIPTYARVLGIALAVVVVPLSTVMIVSAALSAATTYASRHHTAAYAVGDAPRLRLNVQGGDVLIERGDPGRVAVDEQHTVGTITRAAAVAELGQVQFSVSRSGDEVAVTQTGPLFQFATLKRSSRLTVRVPPRTDIDVTSVGNLDLVGVTATVNVHQTFGHATLRDVSLLGDSTVTTNGSDVRLRNVNVSGRATLKTRFGNVEFDGTLAPGGTNLTVEAGSGNVTLTLPYPTDARATIASQVGDVRADQIWHLVRDRPVRPRRWSAELGPNPTGSVAVTTSFGDVTLSVR
jgi:hypothetical protein